MNQKTKSIISIILPIVTIFIIAFAIRTQPTGFVVYENKTLYRINGNISITLQDKIPVDSYIQIKIDDYEIKINLIEFLKKSGKDYKVVKDNGKNYVMGNGIYNVDFYSLGIIQGFEKGKHIIKTEIVYENSLLNGNEGIFEI